MIDIDKLDSLPLEKRKQLIKLIEEKGSQYNIFPLSSEQKRMWFLYQIDPKNPYYNSRFEVQLNGKLDINTLEITIRNIIKRHGILRTRYISIDGVPYQIIDNNLEYQLDKIDLSGLNYSAQKEEFLNILKTETLQPFDLSRELPIKTLLVCFGNNTYSVLITMHHICLDGWSIGLFINNFIEILESSLSNIPIKLQPLKFEYVDYAMWQKTFLESENLKKQLSYWKHTLRDSSPLLNLPADFARPNVPSYKGSAESVVIDSNTLELLNQMAVSAKATLYTLLLTNFFLLVYRLSRQTNINIGTPVANRQKEEFENVFGFFANTVVINSNIKDDMDFMQLLNQVKTASLNAFANQDVPFDVVVDSLGVKRESNFSPLFQVIFSLRNESLIQDEIGKVYNLPDLSVSFNTLGTEFVEFVQFDIIFSITQKSNILEISLGYNKDLFSDKRMKRFLSTYITLLKQVLIKPNLRIKNYKLMLPQDEHQLLAEFGHKFIDNYSVSELLDEVRITDDFDLIYKRRVNCGCISILDTHVSLAPVGLEGYIVFLPEGSNKWFYTGDKGYWKEDGSLVVTYKRHELIHAGSKAFLVSEIEKSLLSSSAVNECKIIVSYINNRHNIFIYYSSDVDLDNSFFCDFFPADLLNHTEIFTYRVNYLPLTNEGVYDIGALEGKIGKNLLEINLVKEKLIENRSVNKVAAVSRKIQKDLNKIPISDLYDISKADYISSGRDVNAKPADLNYAYLKGDPPIELPVKNLGSLFKQTVQAHGGKYIRTIQSGHLESKITYKELEIQSLKIAQGLYNKGLKPHDLAILQISRLENFLKVFWGCIIGGIIPVPLGIPKSNVYAKGDAAVEKLVGVWKHLNHPFVIAGNSEFEGISQIKSVYGLDSLRILKDEDIPCEPSTNFSYYPSCENDVALILFTSGSTGVPKGVQLTHRNAIKRSQATTDANNLNCDDISLNWMPLDHVGGIVMFHIRDVYGGIEQIHVETQEILSDPMLWMDYVNKYNVSLTWAPNFAYGLIVQREKDVKGYPWDLSKLRFILNGGESINENTSKEFMRILGQKGLPDNAMYPSWGMSETSSGVLFSKCFGKRNWNGFVEVGEPINGVEVRIVDDENRLKFQDEIGNFQIKGETVTKGYYKNDEQNHESFTEDGWFKTGDLAVISNNQLAITGRNKDVIIINGVNYHCQEIESAIEETGQVSLGCTAACGVRENNSETEQLAIFYAKAEGTRSKNAEESIRESVLNKIGLSVDYIIELEKDEIPRATLEKIQRSKLKDLFQKGAFNNRLKKNARGIPQWFYEKLWKKADLPLTSDCGLTGDILIFQDENGLGSLLGRILEEKGGRCYFITKGRINERINNTFYIDVSKKESYDWLIETLIKAGVSISQVIHLWNYSHYNEKELDYEGIGNTQYNGVFSLMYLLQGMKANNYLKKKLKIYVVTSYAAYTGNDDIVIPARCTLTGFLKTAVLEIPEVSIKHIDFDCINPENHVKQLRLELEIIKDNMEIAYRNGNRLCPILQKIDMHIDDVKEQSGIKHKGTYVVTGGLGGVGREICKYLLEKYEAKLIILGKTDLNSVCSDNAEKRKEALDALRQKGIVKYASLNIGEKGAFKDAVTRLENELGSMADGIFHLAGEGNLKYHWTVVDNHWITTETKDTFDMMYQPKVYGTKAVFDFASERNQVDVIVFTSVNGIFGGSTFSAYSCANSFADAEAFRRRKTVRNKSISWSIWDNMGMSEGNTPEAREVSKRMGFYMISKSDGLHSLEAIINRELHHAIAGINGSDNNFNAKFHSDDFMRDNHWDIYYSSIDQIPISLNRESLMAYEKENSIIALHHIKEIATYPNGEINYAALNQQSDANSFSNKALTETEKTLKSIWKEVLGHDQFSVEDKFFEVGGNSIKSVQALTAINESFNIKIAIVDLFKYSSVYELASFIDSIHEAAASTEETTGFMF